MTIRPYHAVLASSIASLSVTTSMDLGRAAGFAELAQSAFMPPQDRSEVIEAFDALKERIRKTSLKKLSKDETMGAIDTAIDKIKAMPDKLVQTNGLGGGHVPQSERTTGPHAST